VRTRCWRSRSGRAAADRASKWRRQARAVPAGHVISDKAALQWNEAGDRLFFGVKAQEPKEKPARRGWQKASDVDVFHWNDDRIQTVQAKQAESGPQPHGPRGAAHWRIGAWSC
jgi:hypothetical protein